MDTQLSYYMFVNQGRFPHEIAELTEDEKLLLFSMALKEIGNRPT